MGITMVVTSNGWDINGFKHQKIQDLLNNLNPYNEVLAKDKEITQRKKWVLPVWIIQDNTNQVGMLPTSRPGYVFPNSWTILV